MLMQASITSPAYLLCICHSGPRLLINNISHNITLAALLQSFCSSCSSRGQQSCDIRRCRRTNEQTDCRRTRGHLRGGVMKQPSTIKTQDKTAGLNSFQHLPLTSTKMSSGCFPSFGRPFLHSCACMPTRCIACLIVSAVPSPVGRPSPAIVRRTWFSIELWSFYSFLF